MPVVDVHTHVYPPSYVALLKSRNSVPYIREVPGSDSARLIILPGEDDQTKEPALRGRPIGPEYWDVKQKLAFMDTHKINISVISLANPWLDFLPASEAASTAKQINDGMNDLCASTEGRLYAFGTLPLSGSVGDIVAEVTRLKSLGHMSGVIMGTSGLGKGLDDPGLDKVWEALESTQTLMFLHPHYGLPSEVFGPRSGEYGHVLPLALGFPLETTIAVTRMILAGVFDKFPGLKLLLAHSGGTLPFLAGRIKSCIEHDGHLMRKASRAPRRDPLEILKTNIYLDAVIYDQAGLKAAIAASGSDRLMFGTDHPFFPPLDASDEWLSVGSNKAAIDSAFQGDDATAQAVLGGNAVRVLGLK